MLRYVYGQDLDRFRRLQSSMFRHRAEQFKLRHKWDVDVDENGWERDQYDCLNPLYVIWEEANGSHGGSARFLPTTGRTMVNEHFLHLTNGVAFMSPFIWECTRFCIATSSPSRVAAALMLAGSELMRAFSIEHFVGVFDGPMQRVYRSIGATPEVLNTMGTGRKALSVGLWHYATDQRQNVLKHSGVSSEQSEAWFNLSFGQKPVHRRANMAADQCSVLTP